MNNDTNTMMKPDLGWLPVNPRALGIDGLLFRCPECRCLIIDLDRDEHVEMAHPVTVTAVVRLAEPISQQSAAA